MLMLIKLECRHKYYQILLFTFLLTYFTYIFIDLIYDNYLDFIPSKMKEPDERDFYIKKNQIIDEDNYIYNINVRII